MKILKLLEAYAYFKPVAGRKDLEKYALLPILAWKSSTILSFLIDKVRE